MMHMTNEAATMMKYGIMPPFVTMDVDFDGDGGQGGAL